MSSKPPRRPVAQIAERTKLRQNPMRVQVRAELIGRPTASRGLFTRADVGKQLTATDISSDASHADIHQTGASQTLAVLIPAVGGSLSLITIETQGLGGWLLDDVRILHLGTLG